MAQPRYLGARREGVTSEGSSISITDSKWSGRSISVSRSTDPDAPIAIRTTIRTGRSKRDRIMELSVSEANALDRLLDRAFSEFTKSAKKTLIGTSEATVGSITHSLSVVINGLAAPILVTHRRSIGPVTIRTRRALMRQADIPPLTAQLRTTLSDLASAPSTVVEMFPMAVGDEEDAA